MNVTDQSMGENSLQTRFVTSGIDKDGKPYDIKHSLFLEFDNKDSDKIKRGVEYLESGESTVHTSEAEKRKTASSSPLSVTVVTLVAVADSLLRTPTDVYHDIARTVLDQTR